MKENGELYRHNILRSTPCLQCSCRAVTQTTAVTRLSVTVPNVPSMLAGPSTHTSSFANIQPYLPLSWFCHRSPVDPHRRTVCLARRRQVRNEGAQSRHGYHNEILIQWCVDPAVDESCRDLECPQLVPQSSLLVWFLEDDSSESVFLTNSNLNLSSDKGEPNAGCRWIRKRAFSQVIYFLWIFLFTRLYLLSALNYSVIFYNKTMATFFVS